MKRLVSFIAFISMVLTANAQVNAADSVMNHAKGNRLSVGGYGEVAYTRNFFSDHVSRYSQPEEHRNDPSHGRFDIPHAVIYLGYNFGKGWSLGTEIEFEHGGAGLAYEKEDEEGGEWEQETEKGGEVEYKGQVLIGAFDFTYNAHNWIIRGQADYGYLGDTEQLKYVYNRTNKKSPYHHSAFVSKNAYAVGIEAGYDVFSQISSLRKDDQKFYVFGRYEQYNPYASMTKSTAYDYTEVKRMAFGVNYYPVPEIVIKAEYSNPIHGADDGRNDIYIM